MKENEISAKALVLWERPKEGTPHRVLENTSLSPEVHPDVFVPMRSRISICPKPSTDKRIEIVLQEKS